MSSTTNGAPPEAPPDQVRRVVFATDDPPPTAAVKLPRDHSREGETFFDWIASTSKGLGIVRHDASLSAAAKRKLVEELLSRAADDELFGGSRAGRALLEAAEVWRRMNPEIEGELGRLGDSSRDLAGRSVRGPARAVAIVLEGLTEDPPRALTPAEEELLRHLAPAVTEALEERERVIAAQQDAVLAAVNAAQATYPPGQPGSPIVREPEET